MKKASTYRSAFLNPRVLISFAFCAVGLLLSLLAFAFYPGGNALAAPRLVVGFAPSAVQSTITVTNTNDSGPGSLRQALADANDGDTINFSVTGVITLNSGQLEVDKDLTIDGPGVLALAVDGNASSRVFHIQSGKTVIISDLTVRNGNLINPTAGGGGIYNDHATLTLMNCAITGNSTFGGPFGGRYGGGGIYNLNGTLTLIDCAITGNTAQGDGPNGLTGKGGGIHTEQVLVGSSRDAIVTLRNCTVSNNTAKSNFEAFGGGISQYRTQSGRTATLSITNCTISTNSLMGSGTNKGSGIYSEGVTFTDPANLTVNNSTFSGNGGPSAIALSVTHSSYGNSIFDSNQFIFGGGASSGYNIFADNSPFPTPGPGDQANVDPKLGPLQDNGGPTLTHAPRCGSPAIDHGKNLLGLSTDQRGFARTFDMPAVSNVSGGDGTDVGAVESPVHTYTVSSGLDSGPNTLRQAISDANGSPGTDQIVFTAIPQITLASELQVTDCACINGLGASQSVVSGNNSVRVFNIFPDIDVSFSGLNIQQGNAGANFGG